MKVQYPTSLLQASTQQTVGATLAAGDTITVPTLSQSEVDQVRSYLASREGGALIAHLTSSLAEKPVLTLHPSAQQALETSGVALSPEHRDLYFARWRHVAWRRCGHTSPGAGRGRRATQPGGFYNRVRRDRFGRRGRAGRRRRDLVGGRAVQYWTAWQSYQSDAATTENCDLRPRSDDAEQSAKACR